MEAGKYPKVTPRSATAKKTMNQLVVFLKNLLLLAMMKIIQVIPTRPKKAMNQLRFNTRPISAVTLPGD